MFCKPLLISLGFLGALMLLLILVLFQTSDEDLATYQTLSDAKTLLDEPGRHKRKMVTKDLWLDNGQHVHLTANHSEVKISVVGREFSALEHMQDVQGFLQKEEEGVASFQAGQAIYDYSTSCLSATDVKLTQFEPAFDVSADQAAYNGKEIILSGNISIESSSFNIQSDGVLTIEEKAYLVAKPGKRIFYYDELGRFEADTMTVTYEGTQPTHILISGNVRIEQDDTEKIPIQYALADQVEYVPHTEIMTLSSNEGEQVLFLDPKNETRISARKVIINRKENKVEGVGGVRFSLTDNEIKLFGLKS